MRQSHDIRKPHHISRRQLLAAGGALLATGLTAAPARANDESLKSRAARRGIVFGCAVTAGELKKSPDLGAAIARDCAIVVPTAEMKWGYVEQKRGRPNYQAAEKIASFAREHGIALRGHTAFWYLNIPGWAKAAMNGPDGRDIMIRHVGDIVSHFRGRVVEWDVVNEAIEPRDGGMRKWPPFAKQDPGYIVDCFHAAREADPAATLVYNDFGFEYTSAYEWERRAAALALLAELKKRNAPIDGFGIQCHLRVGNSFDAAVYRKFLADIAALGLKIGITEFDVSDIRLPTDPAERDPEIADHARRVLDVALDETAVTKLLTWGFCNRDSYLNVIQPRPDGTKQRALPLDENLSRTPLWHAIGECLDNAPERA